MINIQFKKATMHNFLCFEHSEVILDSLGYTIVSGKNNRTIDNAISNGSGKSSVFNAISFALTGETIQGLSKNLENIYANPADCWVELEFNINKDHFIVRRIKTPKQDLKIYVNGLDKSGKGIKESNQILTKYLPDLTSMLLGSVIILGQGLPCKFTEGHPGLRKEKLEKLTKSDYMIQSVRTKLDDRKQELALQLRTHEDTKVKLSTQINMYQQQLISVKTDLQECNGETSLTDRLVTLKQAKENWLVEMNKHADHIGVCETNKNDLTTEYNQKKQQCQVDLEHSLEEPSKELADTNGELLALRAEVKLESNRLKKLDAVTDICPTCGQKLINVTKIDTTKDWAVVKEKEVALEELNKKVKAINKNITAIKNSANKQLVSIETDYKESLDKIIKEQQSVKELYEEANSCLSKVTQEYIRLEALLSNYDKLIKNKENLEKTIADLEQQLKNIESQIIIDIEHNQVITNLISLAKREFRGILLENVINYINQRVSYYSKSVFDSDALSFSLNENYIDIIYDGKYYEALSGGEKQKVDIIIQLALRDLLSSQLGITSNILVIDEIFDFLDTKGCQKILGVITSLSNIESVFIISHHINDLSISYDSELIVEKGEDGISHIIAH